MGKFKFPSAYTILFFLIAIVAVLTWIIPAGQYHMAMNEALGKEVPVAGTYAHVEANPQGLISVLMAPIAGLYDPDSGHLFPAFRMHHFRSLFLAENRNLRILLIKH